MAKVIQYTHDDLTEEMKDHGVLQIRFEKDYPPGWINPTSVMETHPIFSVTQNGDIIFRRVTPKEFKLLRIQQGWRGKTGLNISADPRALIFRWRGTLRKPLAPEVESAKLKDRIKALASRLKPIRLPKPQHAFLPARKPLLRMRRGR
ncbi:MAG: hypothetical protein Q7R47_05990 [Candidatus Diapherotrites archaeon]|nr:hypothetical protein [Candidatus Diapherotrites archaeon]